MPRPSRISLPGMTPWNWRPITIPPDSREAWIRLAVWEIWMGMLVAVILGFGTVLVVSASDRVVAVSDFSNCYGPPPVVLPCERIVYRGGALYAVFSALCGVMLIGVALWFLWELWNAAEPRPIADEFLRLLNDSFGRDWRNPLKWPWTRLAWAYGFTFVGASLTAALALAASTLVQSFEPVREPVVHVDTTESFRLGQ